MLFHEIYGSYYHTVSLILNEAVKGNLTKKSLAGLIQKYAFGESFLNIPDGLTGEQWRLLHKDFTTPLTKVPAMPVTILQKRWLKAMLLDPRIQLFDLDLAGLESTAPLFLPEMFVYYDRYADGDPYQDKKYIRNFKTVLTAVQEKKNISVCYESQGGFCQTIIVTPHYLEYSEKDDRFRLYAAGKDRTWILNLARIKECGLLDDGVSWPLQPAIEQKLCFELVNDRNALERVLLHFSHLRKETKRIDRKHYQVTLYYDSQDEIEILIRLLSFGPIIKVTEPERMVQLIRGRVERQNKLACAFMEDEESG